MKRALVYSVMCGMGLLFLSRLRRRVQNHGKKDGHDAHWLGNHDRHAQGVNLGEESTQGTVI